MKNQGLTKWLVFGVTWLAYAAAYFTRKNFSVVKSELNQNHGLSIASLSMIDTCFLFSYALGQFVSGYFGDRFGARRIIIAGLLGSATVSLMVGYSQHVVILVILFALNGLFQSSGWANNIKALEPWFEHAERGKVMAWWGTNQQIGGMCATVMAAYLLAKISWQSAFIVPAFLVGGVGILVMLFLPIVAKLPKEQSASIKGPTYWSLISNPFLIALSLSYFCLKLIRYSLLFWLPFYFNKKLGLAADVAGYASVSFEIGGIAGSFIIGWLSDRYFSYARIRLIMPLMLVLAGAFYCYQHYADQGLLVNCFFMVVIGFLVFGPDALISGACAQDIGGQHTGSVAGFINGVGSVGAILQGALTAYVSTTWGWSALFYVFFIIAMCSACLLVPFVRRPSLSHVV